MQKIQVENIWLKQKIEGAIWGSVLGDVIGAHLQFDNDVTKQKIINSFKIIGGGKHKLEPGQPTDDSQLNYSVCKGLMRSNGQLNLNLIAEEMGNWFTSRPIDIGGTIRNSIPKACNMTIHQAHLCRKGAKENSQGSQSNGSLMALIGLAIWCHKLSPAHIIQAIKEYTILIHPHELVTLTNSFYTLMISFILTHPKVQDSMKIYQFAKKTINQSKALFNPKNFSDFQQWLTVIQNSFDNLQILQKQVSLHKLGGWVRIAFSYSCYFIVKENDFKKVIEYLISNKGDTDTNACIVGGLMGVKLGLKGLNMDVQREKIKQWRPKLKKRPEWMVPGLVIDKIVIFLSQKSPKQLIMIGSQSQYNKNNKK